MKPFASGAKSLLSPMPIRFVAVAPIRRRRPQPNDKWHLDEVVIIIKGQQYYLWRAVDADGQVLDILMQPHRDKRAAMKFFRKLLKSTGFAPRVIVTDKLKSYGAAKKVLIPGVEHRQHRRLNNRAENSHRPTRIEKGAWVASSLLDTRNDSSRPLNRSGVTFILTNIDRVQPNIERRCVSA